MSTLRALREIRKASGSYFLLFCTLIGVVLIAPFLGAGTDATRAVLQLLYAAIPLAAIYAVRKNRALLIVGSIIAVPTMIAAFSGRVDDPLLPRSVSALIAAVFYIFACWGIVIYLATHKDITADTLYAGLSLYMLVGIIFMNAFVILEHAHPGSFFAGVDHNPDGVFQPIEMLYFSFVTLTTLGYGDITPITPQARSLAIVEAIFGVMFMATVIGRVVGIYSSKNSD